MIPASTAMVIAPDPLGRVARDHPGKICPREQAPRGL